MLTKKTPRFGIVPKKNNAKNTPLFGTRTVSAENADVLAALAETKREIDINQEHFDSATDEMLIDGYIYALLSAKMKYQYYLRICKEKNLVAAM